MTAAKSCSCKGSRICADSDPEIGTCIFRAIELLPVPVVSLDGTHLAIIDTGASTSAFFSGQDPAPLAHYLSGKGHFHLQEISGPNVWKRTDADYAVLWQCIGVIGQDILSNYMICIDGRSRKLLVDQRLLGCK